MTIGYLPFALFGIYATLFLFQPDRCDALSSCANDRLGIESCLSSQLSCFIKLKIVQGKSLSFSMISAECSSLPNPRRAASCAMDGPQFAACLCLTDNCNRLDNPDIDFKELIADAYSKQFPSITSSTTSTIPPTTNEITDFPEPTAIGILHIVAIAVGGVCLFVSTIVGIVCIIKKRKAPKPSVTPAKKIEKTAAPSSATRTPTTVQKDSTKKNESVESSQPPTVVASSPATIPKSMSRIGSTVTGSIEERPAVDAIMETSPEQRELNKKLEPFFDKVGKWKWQTEFTAYEAMVKAANRPQPKKPLRDCCEVRVVRDVCICQFPRADGINAFLQGVIEKQPSHILMLNNVGERDVLYYPLESGSATRFSLSNGRFVRLHCTKKWSEDGAEFRSLVVSWIAVGKESKETTFRVTHIRAASLLTAIRERYGSLLSELKEQRTNFKIVNELADSDRFVYIHCENGVEHSPKIGLALIVMRAALGGEKADAMAIAKELHEAVPGALRTPKDYFLGLYVALFALAFRLNPDGEYDHMVKSHNFEIEFLEADHKGDECVRREIQRFEGGGGKKEPKIKKASAESFFAETTRTK